MSVRLEGFTKNLLVILRPFQVAFALQEVYDRSRRLSFYFCDIYDKAASFSCGQSSPEKKVCLHTGTLMQGTGLTYPVPDGLVFIS